MIIGQREILDFIIAKKKTTYKEIMQHFNIATTHSQFYNKMCALRRSGYITAELKQVGMIVRPIL